MANAHRSKKTRFVPRVVFRVAMTGAGVVPVCAGAAVAYLGVGCVAEECFCADGDSTGGGCCGPVVNYDASDVGHPRDAHVGRDASVASDGAADVVDGADGMAVADAFGVADVGFGEAGKKDAPLDVGLDGLHSG
jgi:hypothetical protein